MISLIITVDCVLDPLRVGPTLHYFLLTRARAKRLALIRVIMTTEMTTEMKVVRSTFTNSQKDRSERS